MSRQLGGLGRCGVGQRGMKSVSYARHRLPSEVIRHAVWPYLRFALSFRDVEEFLAERGIEVSYETVRRWIAKFGPAFARNLRRLRPRPTGKWHLDEMVILSANCPALRSGAWSSASNEQEG